MFVVLPNEIHEQIDTLIDGAIAKTPEAAGERADLRAQLVRYFCDWGHLPTAQNLSIEKKPATPDRYRCPRGISDCQCGAEYCREQR